MKAERIILLVGKCTKCGKRYIGWALSRPEYQNCPDCGVRLVVRNMVGKYQPDSETAIAAQRDEIAEWQEAREDETTHFII